LEFELYYPNLLNSSDAYFLVCLTISCNCLARIEKTLPFKICNKFIWFV